MGHPAVAIRVNAWVDKGVADLVAALNDIHGVITLDSCQQGALGEAFVFFSYGHDWRELAALIQELSTLLSVTPVGCGYAFTMEWLGSNDLPRAQVALDPGHVEIFAAAIRGITPELNRRMSESVGDRQGTTPDSLPRCRDR